MKIDSWEQLDVYQNGFEFQQSIFAASTHWPKSEMYSLTDQIRRSSRSVGASICEAWAKRKYAAHFISKLTDADAELQETLHWVRTASACGYISESQAAEWKETAQLIGRQLGAMINRHDSFCY